MELFPGTQVLPVMIMGAFIPGLRRKYPMHEYISALLLVVGLILFTLADAQTSPNFSVIGVVMVSGALVMDSFLGNLQEAIFTMNPETTQVIHFFFSYPIFHFMACMWSISVSTLKCSFEKCVPFYSRWKCSSALQLLAYLS